MKEVAETLKIAVKHHQAGRLTDAEQQYQLILQNDPDNPARMIPDDHEMAAIEEMKRLRQEGLSYQKIAEQLKKSAEK